MQVLKWILISAIVGVIAGVASTLFHFALLHVTDYRRAHLEMIYFLPLAGFAIGWCYQLVGQTTHRGQGLILDEIHNTKKILPLRMAPLVFVSTLVTHLFGGSAGREGTAVQISASLADQLSHLFPLTPGERRRLLMCAMGAGFAAALGTPLAGAIFGMEVIAVGRFRLNAWMECLTAAGIAYGLAVFLNAPHSVFPTVNMPLDDLLALGIMVPAGLVAGLTARLFIEVTHGIQHAFEWIKYKPLRPFLAGCVLSLAIFSFQLFDYAGLGLYVIQDAFHNNFSLQVPLIKGLMSALTVGSGFKGGEFIPLAYIGSTLGSALSAYLPVSTEFLAAIGFASVFAGASNTPLACTFMAMELFGFQIGPYAVIACYMSFLCSGRRGIYESQKGILDKPGFMNRL